MLERHEGRVPDPVRDAVGRAAAPSATQPRSAVERGRRRARRGPPRARRRRAAARASRARYATLAGEMHLFVVQLKPTWSLARMAEHHERLLDGLEAEGPPALRRHLRDGAQTVIARA